MDNVLQLLNTQFDIAPPKDHDEEIALIGFCRKVREPESS
ncbi:hypothetical protein VDA_000212 [Photobacterium damselae subsp. damselae CIP 102761]|uniref:Uncharacterized protein n=2 Tax=Photobacterium damselae TaxID=38293 RepID=D0Z4X9_PHODD|nr:hypothetical protein VDA_000212 [Photobacterium damselae subsp. damselae CIP 102761]